VISSVCITSQLDKRHLGNVVTTVRAAARRLSEWNGYTPHAGDEAATEVALV
jgi:hypothetical protein